MNAGDTLIKVGTRATIKNLKGGDSHLSGLSGKVTHPFGFGGQGENWIGLWLDSPGVVKGDNCNVTTDDVILDCNTIVLDSPAHVKEPDQSLQNVSFDRYRESCKNYRSRVNTWLINSGYNNCYTGEIIRVPTPEGFAEYMIADLKEQPIIVKMQVWDGLDKRGIEDFTKEDFLKLINQ